MADEKKEMSPVVATNFIEDIIDEELKEGGRCYGQTIETRFPPEPNGYLHIGHVKAFCIDFGTAEKYGGHCHLRMDNPHSPSSETNIGTRDAFCNRLVTSAWVTGFPL